MTRSKAAGAASSNVKPAPSSRIPSTGRLAIALTCTTMLAGVPTLAVAQEAAPEQAPTGVAPTSQPTPAPTPTPAPAPSSNIIRTISVAGAERLEPTTILSYIRLRVGDEFTAAAGDQALKDLGATELFADFRIANRDVNVVITVVENTVINRIVF